MKKILIMILPFVILSCTEEKKDFTIYSPDFEHREILPKKFEFNSFGCGGDNFAPTLKWKNPPRGTKSYVVTVYDPDAPTGSGWWHFAAYNIDYNKNKLQNMKVAKGAKIVKNDAGIKGYMGPCPPKNHGRHNYVFSVIALDVEKLKIDENSSPALLGYLANQHKIDATSVVAVYER